MRLNINLATRRYINLRQLDLALVLGFLLLGAVALYCALKLGHNASEIARIKAQIQGLIAKGHGVPVTQNQLKAQAARVGFANEVIERKSVNWINLLNRLEEVVPTGVAITDLTPDRAQALKISGIARGFDNIRALMENMERSRNFSEMYLLSQADAKVGLTQRGITFTISCKVNLQ